MPFLGEPMTVSKEILQHMGFPPEHYVAIPDSMSEAVTVTAASETLTSKYKYKWTGSTFMKATPPLESGTVVLQQYPIILSKKS